MSGEMADDMIDEAIGQGAPVYLPKEPVQPDSLSKQSLEVQLEDLLASFLVKATTITVQDGDEAVFEEAKAKILSLIESEKRKATVKELQELIAYPLEDMEALDWYVDKRLAELTKEETP